MRYLAKAILTLCLTLFISGCMDGAMPPAEVGQDENIQTVQNIKTIPEITQIGFEWTPIYSEQIAGYHIYRGLSGAEMLERVAIINDRYVSHYVDEKLTPATTYTYQIRAFTYGKQESLPTQVSETTLQTIESISFIQAITGLPNRIKLVWRPHSNPRVGSYIIERNELDADKWTKIAEVKGRLNAEYIDANLKDNYVYHYRVFVKTYDDILSLPSEVLQAGTKKLPPEVEGLKATRDQPAQITVTWAPSTISDIAHYKIYRASSTVLFYSFLAQTNETSYTDILNNDSINRYYKITVVDKDGLESPRQEFPVMGTTLAPPLAPVILNVSSNTRSASIRWSQVDQRAVKYEVKKSGSGLSSLLIQDIMTNEFTDNDVVAGGVYNYEVYSIDSNGMVSKASQSIRIQIPAE